MPKSWLCAGGNACISGPAPNFARMPAAAGPRMENMRVWLETSCISTCSVHGDWQQVRHKKACMYNVQ